MASQNRINLPWLTQSRSPKVYGSVLNRNNKSDLRIPNYNSFDERDIKEKR